MEGYYSAPGINVIIPFAAKHEGCGTEIVVKPEILVNVYGSWPTGTNAEKMKREIEEAIKRNLPKQKAARSKDEKPLSALIFDWMKIASDPSKDPRPMMREIWGRLKQILSRLSGVIEEKSHFKKNSIWYLDTVLYDRVLIESVDKNEGVFTFKPGDGRRYLYESLLFPLGVDNMEFENVVRWALAHDDEAYVPQGGWLPAYGLHR